jgi:hypothetical protein
VTEFTYVYILLMFLFFSGGQKIYFEGARLDVIQNPGIIFKYRPTNSEFVVVSLLLLAKNIKKNVDASCYKSLLYLRPFTPYTRRFTKAT